MVPGWRPGQKKSPKDVFLMKAKEKPIVLLIGPQPSGYLGLHEELTADDTYDISTQKVINLPSRRVKDLYASCSLKKLKHTPDLRRYERTMLMVTAKVLPDHPLEVREMIVKELVLSRIRDPYSEIFPWFLMTPKIALSTTRWAETWYWHVRAQLEHSFGAVLVYDRMNMLEFFEVWDVAEMKWIEYDNKEKKWVKREIPEGRPFCRPLCVVGLETSEKPKTHPFKKPRKKLQVTTKDGKELADALGVEYFECSLWPRRGVTRIMEFITGTYHNEYEEKKKAKKKAKNEV